PGQPAGREPGRGGARGGAARAQSCKGSAKASRGAERTGSSAEDQGRTVMRNPSTRIRFLVGTMAAAALVACGGERIPPKQLVDARSEFQQAKTGIAMQLDPTDVHVADLALQQAEQAW